MSVISSQPGFRGPRALVLAALVAVVFSTSAYPAEETGVVEAYKWSVQYLIDNSQPSFSRSQKTFPRHVRALAVTPDGRFLYAGYNQSFNNSGEVRKIDLRVADYESATVAVLQNHRGKAIAVDDEGRVYLAEGRTINIYDARLVRSQEAIQTENCDGVAVAREGSSLVLYATERDRNTLNRWVLQTRAKEVTGAVLSGFGEDTGELQIPEARSLRGVAVDSKGRIWMADVTGNKVFRVDRTGENLQSVEVRRPLAIGFDGSRAFVTRETDRAIALLDVETMSVTGTLGVPWEELQLAPAGNNHRGALAGIAVVPGGKGFYVANESGQTANQKSTYGRTDANTDFVNGILYIDSFGDDNEPILRAVPVPVSSAPATVGISESEQIAQPEFR